jgi:hypothetical protein
LDRLNQFRSKADEGRAVGKNILLLKFSFLKRWELFKVELKILQLISRKGQWNKQSAGNQN